ncbi:zinc finger and BTB domain-containing protein 38 isoform X2 [Amblyraja radiata]|uniref:zinc finger and BTB domain-containing protein 38 isoform X2 n=1 Tax=Amblyraja radiata TaxID=386614 RepID=UPI0014031CD7|nr:zinc finger and BTB domain-containing protein 38 isoform X2 [Amblyraja radiata]
MCLARLPSLMTVMPSSTDIMDNSHSQTVLGCLNEQRTKGVFCDVTIVVEDTKFKAHKNVLAASSTYFKNLFSSQELWLVGHILELPDFKADVFAEILHFIYSAKVVAKGSERAKDLVDGGKRLGISFLENLAPFPQQHIGPVDALCSSSSNSTRSLSPASSLSLSTGFHNLKAEASSSLCDKSSEDFPSINGPRITNAFSIFNLQDGSDLYFPLDLTANGNKKAIGSDKLPMVCAPQDTNRAQQKPAQTFAEHSYAVFSARKAQQNGGHSGVQEPSEEKEKPLCSDGCNAAGTGTGQDGYPVDQLCKTNQPLHATSSTDFKVLRFNLNALQATSEGRPVGLLPLTDPLNEPTLNTQETTGGVTAAEKCSPARENVTKPVPNAVSSETMPEKESQAAYSCMYCPRSFSTRVSLNVHSQIHTTLLEKPLSCRHCGKPFVHLKRLQTHEHLCRGPGTVLPDSGPTEEHMENFSSDNEVARSEEDLNMSSCASEPENTNKRTLNLVRSRRGSSSPDPEHFVKVVEGHILYFCSVCKRSYVTLSSLKRHANVHSWRRSYPCHYCSKVFALAEYRTKHEIWHTGERRYQCIFCLETFMTYYTLKTHQKAYHGIDPGLPMNRKTANVGYRAKMYPFKLYRLLPMKLQKRPYKTYTRSCPNRFNRNQVSGVSSNDENMAPVDLGNLSITNPSSTSENLQDNLISSETIPSEQSLHFASTRDGPSEEEQQPRLPGENGCQYNASSPAWTSTEGEANSSSKRCIGNGPQGLATDVNTAGLSVINYGHTAPSVIMHSNRVSSVIKHGNAFSSVITYSGGTELGSDGYPTCPKTNISSDSSDAKTRKSITKDGVKTQNKSGLRKAIESAVGSGQLAGPGATHKNRSSSFSAGSRTETYIAKPACPGTSRDNQVAPLCQITVKIGDKAVVQRHISGSKLFRRKGRKPKWMVGKEDKVVESFKMEEDEDQNLKSSNCPDPAGSIADPAGGLETCDEMSDHDSNDKLWRPYYTYKPKKKAKGFHKMRKSRWKKQRGTKDQIHPDSVSSTTEEKDVDIPEEITHGNVVDDESQESSNRLDNKIKPVDEEMESNLKWNLATKSYSCTLCTRLFTNSSTLKTHLRCHTGEQPFTCETCGRRFSVQGNLHKHERIHLGMKEFVCAHCDKAFTLSETLKKHERIHTGEKRYRCRFCPKRFLYLSTKKNHEQKHLERKRAQQEGREHVCFQCFKICKTAAALGMHQKKHSRKYSACEGSEGLLNGKSDQHANMMTESKHKNEGEAEGEVTPPTIPGNVDQINRSLSTELGPVISQTEPQTVPQNTDCVAYPWASSHEVGPSHLQRTLPENSENMWKIHQQSLDINLPLCTNISYNQCDSSHGEDERLAFYQRSSDMFYSRQVEGIVYKAM